MINYKNVIIKSNIVLLIVGFSLSGCVTGTTIKSGTSDDASTSFAGNYQEIYQRTYAMAQSCLPNGPAGLLSPVTNVTEGQLYTDLGYGEIKVYQKNLVIIPWVNAKIEKSGAGTKVTIVTANAMEWVQADFRRKILNWVKGEKSCD